jgi:hypothetical protein
MKGACVSRRYSWRMAIVGTGIFLASSLLSAQTRVQLDDRITSPLREAVEAILDSAAQAGLPTGPLADKALEGVSKGAEPSKIVAAVRSLRGHLQTAKAVLGPASDAELEAGAAALRAGVPATTLASVRQALPKRSLVIPLAVLSSMVRKGVPTGDATNAVVAYAKTEDDKVLLALSSAVDRNLAAGLAARTALIHAEGIIGSDRGAKRSPKP